MDVLTYYLNETAPAITRSLSKQDSGDFDITTETFKLRVRPLWSDQVSLDVAMVADPVQDTISYQPQVGDFDTEGIYRAWIYVDFGAGLAESTDEFEISVLAHAPGQGARVGAIWRAARALEPVAWDALRGYSDYGDPELQRVIDLAKLRVLPASYDLGAAAEFNYDPRVVDYIAKKVLVDNVLSAAISFWTNQAVQQNARGNSEEVVTYPDRIRAAENAILRYGGDLERQLGEVEGLLGSVSTQYDAPALSGGNVPLLTHGLDEYQPQPVTVPYPWWRYPRQW